MFGKGNDMIFSARSVVLALYVPKLMNLEPLSKVF